MPGDFIRRPRTGQAVSTGPQAKRGRRPACTPSSTTSCKPIHMTVIGRRWTAARVCRLISPGERSHPRQLHGAVQARLTAHGLETQAQKFLSELGWREFDYGLLVQQPELHQEPFKRTLSGLKWRKSPADLEAWRRGRTGYPIVDAGMRQLWTLGWMHNRVRLITSSFLVKHLLIDWREGEAWFWDCLVDADPANNPANWQWIAGTGADAQPFFRIFNPVTQGEKFDPAGDYVRQWVPELAKADRRWDPCALDRVGSGPGAGWRQARSRLPQADRRARSGPWASLGGFEGDPPSRRLTRRLNLGRTSAHVGGRPVGRAAPPRSRGRWWQARPPTRSGYAPQGSGTARS